MKYLVVVIAVIALSSAGLLGYICLNPGFLIHTGSSGNQITSDELKNLDFRLNKLSNELTNLKDIINQQSLFIQKLKEDNLSTSLEKRIQSSGKQGSSDISIPLTTSDQQADSSGLQHQTFSTELFNNPEFAKIFHDKVGEVIKDIQQKEREEQMKRFSEQIQQMLTKRIDDFAKAQNLNDYQKQELNRIVSERSTKTMELFSKMRNQEITFDKLRTDGESLRKESNEQVKQILLPQQYEEYSKIEEAFNRGGMMQPGQGNPPPPPPR